MPNAPKRFHPEKKHTSIKSYGWEDDRYRGNRHKRGYDSKWEKLRNAFILQHPLCRICEDNGHATLATDVDHMISFRGINDPLRLDVENLQSLCKSCHKEKTKKEGSNGRPN